MLKSTEHNLKESHNIGINITKATEVHKNSEETNGRTKLIHSQIKHRHEA